MFSMNRSLFRSVRGTLSSAARSSAVRAIVGIAGLAATSGTALAQDCKLGVQATPNVLYAGQSASVDVVAYFPSDIRAVPPRTLTPRCAALRRRSSLATDRLTARARPSG